MRGFSKRRYRRPAELVRDVVAVSRQRRQLRGLLSGESVAADFRERLMLAVTEVNGCRYCSYGHSRLALAAGVPPSDVDALTAGDLSGAPRDQVPALLYAQHWAESDAEPDPAARERIVQTYGEAATGHIELALRLIRVGNLVGNTCDYGLFRLSRGRWGDSVAPGVVGDPVDER